MDIRANFLEIKQHIPENVRLIAVSKFKPVEMISDLYVNSGQADFGENRVQELIIKQKELPEPINWHFIGHLQSNKIKLIAPFVYLIHGVDSFKLLTEINREASGINRVIDCLLQFHIAREDTKFGFNLEEAERMLASSGFGQLKNVRIRGVMGMASYSEDKDLVRKEFAGLRAIFCQLKETCFIEDSGFKELSMGMSGDYRIAIEEGSTMIRIGSLIFGER
jgi:PLP dependent protein